MARRSHGLTICNPIKSDGTLEVEDDGALGPGAFTLASGTTYYFPLVGGYESADKLSVHLVHDAAIIITSATIEDSNFPAPALLEGADVGFSKSWFNSTAGFWIDEDPSTAFVGTVGAGTSASNGVVATAGSAAGGAMWHFVDACSRRARLKVVVGGTGGQVIVATWTKE